MRNPSDGRSALTDSCLWGRFLTPLVVGTISRKKTAHRFRWAVLSFTNPLRGVVFMPWSSGDRAFWVHPPWECGTRLL